MKKIAIVLFFVLFVAGCKTVQRADGTTKSVPDTAKIAGGAEAVAPFLPFPFGTILLGLAGVATAIVNKDDEPS